MKRILILSAAAILLVGGVAFWVSLDRGIGTVAAEKPGEKPQPAPEFTGVTQWLNSEALKLADQKGKVVVVHFWTNGCINCVNNYPHYRAWQEKYAKEKNFLMVGVHTPEFDAEKKVDRIKERMEKNKLTFAVAVDNDTKNWEAWGNRYWPAIYVVDKSGNIREKWEGELGDKGYKQMTEKIDAMLKESK